MNKVIFFISFIIFSTNIIAQKKQGFMKVIFEHLANGKNIIYNDSSYINAFHENYSLSKLKYYVSDIHFVYTTKKQERKSVHLIDASKKNSLAVSFFGKGIKGISFLLGVDSLNNCSGAQSGPLDPLNDMFWTWNNGYIIFKLEGKSDSSKVDNNRIEHHVGGYKGANKAMREIALPINENYFKKHNTIIIQLNIDKYWMGINKLRIAETPVITAPGVLAKTAADNFEGMFLIKK